ncbi:MAG: hypothetical protein HQK67_12050, partial [Desulfamplus sp.]|nr:hypothetical protein [Desulfamplus sp.]
KTVSANLTGLAAGTTYNFRLVATNSAGTTYGNNQFFTTTSTQPDSVTSYKVLTNQSGQFTINYGEYVRVFGSSGGNTINVQSGGKVECVNFIGANIININDNASDFKVYRSGATVYLRNISTGTFIKIPATKTPQTLDFTDGSLELVISSGKVMIGTQEITKTEMQLYVEGGGMAYYNLNGHI